jgi:hypothetical protein
MTVQYDEYRAGLFAEFWADFNVDVVPPDAPMFQRRAMYQAFLGGAVAFNTALTCAVACASEADGDVVKAWQDCEAELNALIRSMPTAPIAAATGASATVMHNGEVIASNVRIDGDAPRISVFDTRGLSDDDVRGLNDLIRDYLAERKPAQAATH